MITNHCGDSDTFQHFNMNYHWLEIKREYYITAFVCKRAKYSRHTSYPPVVLTDINSKAFVVVHCDLFYFDSKD